MDPDDTLDQVKHKERTLARLSDRESPLTRWKEAADLWCAGWFSNRNMGRILDTLVQDALSGRATLPAHISNPVLDDARAAAADRRFFHWTLEFPEVFFGIEGRPLSEGGFDAILGNPPWEMLRVDSALDGHAPATAVSELARFARNSGVYSLQGTGHSNLYQLFVERGLSLLRTRGRLGFIVPGGFAADHGCAELRRELLDRTTIDTFATFENRDRIFPIHRSVKFTLLTLSKGGSTAMLPLRTGMRTPDTLDTLADAGSDAAAVLVPRSVLTRVSGRQAAVPEIRSAADLELLARISYAHRPLADADGWGLHFGRELNATDDRPYFRNDRSGLPVVEGKHLQPFRVDVGNTPFTILPADARRLLAHEPFTRPRLAYRDVASSTNRVTLIAAIVPPRVVTTHTVFCLKGALDLTAQHFLCGIFNSFAANYFVRMRVSTHVTTALMAQLPVPAPPRTDPAFLELANLAKRLSEDDTVETRARQQAVAAQLYGFDEREFSHVLEGFPLVSSCERQQALAKFRCIVGNGGM
jgi:hypothetical protein